MCEQTGLGLDQSTGPSYSFSYPCHQHPHTDQTHTANILQTSVAFIVKLNIFVAETSADTWLKKNDGKIYFFFGSFSGTAISHQ